MLSVTPPWTKQHSKHTVSYCTVTSHMIEIILETLHVPLNHGVSHIQLTLNSDKNPPQVTHAIILLFPFVAWRWLPAVSQLDSSRLILVTKYWCQKWVQPNQEKKTTVDTCKQDAVMCILRGSIIRPQFAEKQFFQFQLLPRGLSWWSAKCCSSLRGKYKLSYKHNMEESLGRAGTSKSAPADSAVAFLSEHVFISRGHLTCSVGNIHPSPVSLCS